MFIRSSFVPFTRSFRGVIPQIPLDLFSGRIAELLSPQERFLDCAGLGARRTNAEEKVGLLRSEWHIEGVICPLVSRTGSCDTSVACAVPAEQDSAVGSFGLNFSPFPGLE